MEESTFLTKFASEVTIVHRRDEFPCVEDHARSRPKERKDQMDYRCARRRGPGCRQGRGHRRSSEERGQWQGLGPKTDALFLAIGHIPNTKIFQGQLDLDEQGYIISQGGAQNERGKAASTPATCRIASTVRQLQRPGPVAWPPLKAERFLEATGE